MATFAFMLKNEIRRLARREAKAMVLPIKRDKIALKSALRELKRELKALDQQTKALTARVKSLSGIQAKVAPATDAKIRITAKGIRALRRKLRLSQADFARLVQVSPLTVFQWEKKSGALTLRGNKELTLAGLRQLGARDAKRQLESLKPARKAKSKR